MFLLAATIFASSAGTVFGHPFNLSPRDVAAFPAGSSWDIVLNKGDAVGNVKQVLSENIQVIDIDLFDTDKATIADLKASKQVICYFSAGTKEGWRPDASDFKDGDVGKNMDDWPDEAWLNVKSDNVRNIMKKRIQKAAESGCSAVDPDNVDGFDGGQDGFGYDKTAYADYVKFLAEEAKNNNLAIGLKNAVDLIPDVVGVMQFAINEQCHEYAGECAKYKPFTEQNKAVFNIEYGGNSCENPNGVKLSTLIKPDDQGLNTLGGACAGQNQGTPTNGETSPSSAPAASASAPSKISAGLPSPTSTGTGNPAQPAPTSVDGEEPEEDPEQEPVDKEGEDEEGEENPPSPTATSRPGRNYGWR